MDELQAKDELLFGLRAVAEALDAGHELGKVWMARDSEGPLTREVTGKLRKRGVPIQFVPNEKLHTLARGKNHQGIVAQMSQVEFATLTEVLPAITARNEVPLVVALDRVTDVRNFGGIARTALCAGAHALVVPQQRAATPNADAIKTSAGALLQLPVCREENFKKSLYTLLDHGLQLVAVTEKASDSLFDLPMQGPTALLFGSEEDGIQQEFMRLCTARGKLPMLGPIDSLNVGAAAAVALFEVVRQRTAPPATS